MNMIKNIRLCNFLGFNTWNKFKLFVFLILSYIQDFFHINNRILFQIKIKNNDRLIDLFLRGSSDYTVLREVFYDEEYKWSIDFSPKTIIDFGSNIGMSALYFNNLYPEANIFCFEPNSEAYRQLIINTKKFKKINCFNYAISDTNEGKLIYSTSGTISSSLYNRSKYSKKKYVKSISLQQVFKLLNIKEVDLLKFDIEGEEFKVFETNHFNSKIKYLIGEVHEDIAGKKIENLTHSFKNFNVETRKLNHFRYLVKLRNCCLNFKS